MSRIVICALARHERAYINDWIRWHAAIGVDHFYIYDNDDVADPPLLDAILPQFHQYVSVLNIRGRHEHMMQHRVYEEFYRAYGDTFDWCAIIDVDEFIDGVEDVHEWLDRPVYNLFQAVRIKWRLFGDDGMVERNMELPVWEAFHQESHCALSNQAKSIVRGGLRHFVSKSSHWFKANGMKLVACLPDGTPTNAGLDISIPYPNTIFLNHYRTKTLSEFMQQKYQRGDAMWDKRPILLDYYFRQNEQTAEKEQWLEEHYGIKL